MAPHVLILAGDSDRNLGDCAILAATCAELRRCHPGVVLTVVSRDREWAAARFGARVVPAGLRGLARLCAEAARADLVLCGGGGLFQDDDSLAKMPYWAARVVLARLLCPRVVGYALGVGPLQAASSRAFARIAFACMERMSARDGRARALAQRLTRARVELVPDPALLLEPADRAAVRAFLEQSGVALDGRPLIGVAPRRWFPAQARVVPHQLAWQLGGAAPAGGREEAALCARLAEALDEIAAERGARVLFLPSYCASAEGDARICREIAARMRSGSAQLLELRDPALYKGITRELAVLLGGRMHPAILAASAGTPVVGLAYNPKFQGWFELLGRSDLVLDVQELVRAGSAQPLLARLRLALATPGPDAVRMEKLSARVRAFCQELLPCAA